MVELPLDELLARGEAQLDKDHAAFVETARRIDPAKTPAEVMKSLSDEHPTAEDLIPSVERSVEDARRFLVEKDLVTIPSEVRPRDRGDAALRARRQLRVDGHAGAVRGQGHGSLLLRDAGREGLGREAPGRAPAPLQPLRGRR